MELATARDFLRDHHRAVLLTTRADGGPQMSPVLVGLDAEGYAVISTRETAAKCRNVLRTPEVALCVLSDGFFGTWAQIEGTAEVIRLPEAMEHLENYYRGISGEHEDWDDYRAAMERERRVVIRVKLTKAGPDRHG
ncbi:PPOX class F420-dependent oxidoreductase [Nonomuraea sp. NPDC050310]|uniref:PPOX class F420-dependent oxidoreductase n=1 Tax=Nonomuraea sp. NPDC050310 TaxID=3154935 RepID=UPI00340D78E8